MLHKVIIFIKKKNNILSIFFYKLAKYILYFNVPAIRIIFTPLLYIKTASSLTITFFLQKVINEPLLKVRCIEVGQRVRIEKGFPLISQNLLLKVGNGVTINGKNTFSSNTVIEHPELCIGNKTYIGYGVTISVGERVSIGENCLIAGGVFICDNNGHPTAPNRRHLKIHKNEIMPVVICDNVWIGNGAFIGKGVTIGEGAIIGANSVVVKNIPPNCIFSGNPGRIIRTFNTDEIGCILP